MKILSILHSPKYTYIFAPNFSYGGEENAIPLELGLRLKTFKERYLIEKLLFWKRYYCYDHEVHKKIAKDIFDFNLMNEKQLEKVSEEIIFPGLK